MWGIDGSGSPLVESKAIKSLEVTQLELTYRIDWKACHFRRGQLSGL
jgi:hypothetical protein